MMKCVCTLLNWDNWRDNYLHKVQQKGGWNQVSNQKYAKECVKEMFLLLGTSTTRKSGNLKEKYKWKPLWLVHACRQFFTYLHFLFSIVVGSCSCVVTSNSGPKEFIKFPEKPEFQHHSPKNNKRKVRRSNYVS